MSDEKHPNDEYVNPGSATAIAPIPPEGLHDGSGEKRTEDPDALTPEDIEKQDAEAKEQGEDAMPEEEVPAGHEAEVKQRAAARKKS
jgi:hypothetical protein